jgi:serine/threonine protein kinase
MEYCPAGDLLEWLKKNPTESEKIDCFYQLCKGVAALHESEFKVVHRDLKPSNILLGADSNFKISDLGLSVSLLAEETRPTTSNWVSPGFSPPEQFNNMKSVLETGDIYSLGAILRFMLTGKNCRESTDVDFDEIPKGMRQALQIMIEEYPNKRFRIVRLIPEFIERCMGNPEAFIYDCKKCGGKGLGEADPGDNYVGYACPECGDSGSED